MAYVGTARILGTPRDTLASVIQGEAGGQGLIGMQAVGGVIANRAAINFSGYGYDPVSQATARMQFQGQSGTPSAAAYSVADSVLAGTNPDPTGGALNYANPGASSASWARNLNSGNSLQIGDHYFTDNTRGVPFQPNFSSAPANTNNPTDLTGSSGLGGASPVMSPPGVAGGITNPAPTGNYYYNPQTGAVTPTTDQIVPGTDPAMNIDAQYGVLYGAGTGPAAGAGGLGGGGGGSVAGFDSTGGFTALNPAGGLSAQSTGITGLSAPGINASQYSLQGATLDTGVTAQSLTGGGAGAGDPIVGYNAAGPVTGAPTVTAAINLSGQKVSGSVDKGSQQIGSDVKTAGQTVGQSITGAAKTAQGISDSWQSLGKDYFARLVFIVVGLIAIAAALMMFKPVQQVAGTIAAKVPKVPV